MRVRKKSALTHQLSRIPNYPLGAPTSESESAGQKRDRPGKLLASGDLALLPSTLHPSRGRLFGSFLTAAVVFRHRLTVCPKTVEVKNDLLDVLTEKTQPTGN